MLNANKTTFAANKDAQTTLQQCRKCTSRFLWRQYSVRHQRPGYRKTVQWYFRNVYGKYVYPEEVENDFPNVKADTFGFFPEPLNDNQVVAINPGGPTKFIYTGSKNIAAAKQLLTFLTQPENLQYRLDNDPNVSSLNFPALKKDKFDAEQKEKSLPHTPSEGLFTRQPLNMSMPNGEI